LQAQTISTETTDTRDTQLGRAIAPLLAAHPNLSGIFPLRDARDAFAARIRLAQRAEATLDAYAAIGGIVQRLEQQRAGGQRHT